MSDVVVTVPKSFGLQTWIDEGDAAGEPWSGTYWAYYLQEIPDIQPGELVYVVCNGIYSLIEACSAGPYLELFARARRRNWIQFGNEVGAYLPVPGV